MKRVKEFLEKNTILSVPVEEVISACGDFESFDEFRDTLNDFILDDEHFVLDLDAMDYLKENDPNLSSIQIAIEEGFDIDQLNSVVLANLLIRQERLEELSRLEEYMHQFQVI